MPVDPNSAKAIFLTALEKSSPDERAAFLNEACAGADSLRRRVEELLQAHEQSGRFLDSPAVALAEAAGEAPDRTEALTGPAHAEAPNPAVTQDDPSDAEADDRALTFLTPSTKPDSLGRLGHYEVLQVLGRGGFGIVFRAFDDVLQRVVAVKVLAPQLAATSPARKRFLREARSSAAVRHENVVQVHAVEESPLPYLVMEFIPGETLQQRLDRTGPLEVPEILPLGRQLAEGLAAAHVNELIHRDVKPANVLIEGGPQQRVKLTDFGLARAADDASISQSGVVAGTPMYMAPEQAQGEVIDQRADLFSLGSVLYVMCTGRSPFRASGTLAVLKRVCEEQPRPIRQVIPEVPEWLCRIIEKLHAKDPADRFASAREVADVLADCEKQWKAQGALRDFGRIPGGGPRKSRRRAWAAAAVGLVVVAALVVLAVWNLDRPDGSGPVARSEPPGNPPAPARRPLEELLKRLSPLDGRQRSDIPPQLLALAGGGDPDRAPAELVAVLGPHGPFTLPRWATTHAPAVSPDGKWLAVPCGNTVAVFDAATGASRRTLSGATGQLNRVAFSHDGKRVGAGGADGNAYVWDAESGKLELTLDGHRTHVWVIAFSPNGKRIATGCNDGSVFLWDQDGKNRTPLGKQSRGVDSLAFGGDGKTLAAAGEEGVVVLWDTAAGTEVQSLRGHTGGAHNLRYSPDGKTLASGGKNETILWDLDDGKPRHTLPVSAPGLLAFTADGKTLLAASGQEEFGGYVITRWNPQTGKRTADVPLGPRRKGMAGSRYFAVSPDGTTAYACHPDGDDRVSVFDAVTGKERFPRADFHAGPVWAVAVSPDGKTLATGGEDHTIRLWDLAAWKVGEMLPPCRILEGHTDQVWYLVFSPDGKALASAGNDGILILWDPATGKKLRDPLGKVAQFGRPGFSSDGKTLASPQNDGSVILYETGVAKEVSWPLHKAAARTAAISPDGKLVASGGHDGTVSVVNRADGKAVYVFDLKVPAVGQVAFSPDGKRLLATTGEHNSGRLFVWDVASGKQLASLTGQTGNVEALALHPAGRLAATGSRDGVRVWDVPTGRSQLFDVGRWDGAFWMNSVAFTPEGRYLVAGGPSGIVCIWKTPEFPVVPSEGPDR